MTTLQEKIPQNGGQLLSKNMTDELLTNYILFVRKKAIGHLGPLLNKEKITFSQFFLFVYLMTEKHLSLSEASEKMKRARKTITSSIVRLEKRTGYIERLIKQGDDLRYTLVQMTESGIDFIGKMNEQITMTILEKIHRPSSSTRLGEKAYRAKIHELSGFTLKHIAESLIESILVCDINKISFAELFLLEEMLRRKKQKLDSMRIKEIIASLGVIDSAGGGTIDRLEEKKYVMKRKGPKRVDITDEGKGAVLEIRHRIRDRLIHSLAQDPQTPKMAQKVRGLI